MKKNKVERFRKVVKWNGSINFIDIMTTLEIGVLIGALAQYSTPMSLRELMRYGMVGYGIMVFLDILLHLMEREVYWEKIK